MNSNLTPELDELEAAALFGTGPQMEISYQEIEREDLLEEIKRVLSGGRHTQVVRAHSCDIERINRNLQRFLDAAEALCPRKAIDQAYATRKATGSCDYSWSKHRFTTSNTNRAMTERFALVRAACEALRTNGHAVDDTQACVDLFKDTDARMEVSVMRDQEALLDAGWQLSDAWWLIAEALDRECDFTGWFSALSDKATKSCVPLAQFLGVDVAIDLATQMANYEAFSQSTGNTVHAEDIADQSFEPAHVEFDRLNLPHHIHDLAAAPTVPLFRHLIWRSDGKLRNLLTGETRKAWLFFWRENLLMLLPSSNGIIAPYIVNRLRASLYKSSEGPEISLRYPFTRALDFAPDGSTLPHAPIFLANSSDVHRFEPEKGWPEEDHGLPIGTSIRSQYAQVWDARPDIIPLFLRWHIDEEEKPFDPEIAKTARRGQPSASYFPANSLGAAIERATLVADRGAGIGALLRVDFHRKVALLRNAGGKDHLPPLPRAFTQTWS